MGVVYKLKSEVTKFILATRKNNPRLGCRAIASLIEKKYKIEVSKSSVNDLLKTSGLNLPVGRRHKSRRNEIFGRGLGAILLKSADYLLGGIEFLAGEMKKKNDLALSDLRQGLEYQLYLPLFGDAASKQLDSGLWPLIDLPSDKGSLPSVASALPAQYRLSPETAQGLFACLRPARGLKLVLADSTCMYCDGQMHTAWHEGKVPERLSTTLLQGQTLIRAYAQGESPLVLFMAPGYDAPAADFFHFLKSASASGNKVVSLALLDSRLQELEEVTVSAGTRGHFIFGLWPWQFPALRKIKLGGEFKSFYFTQLKEEIYIAPAAVELFKNTKEEGVVLQGCALKSGLNEEIRLFILGNSSLDNSLPQADLPTAGSLDNLVRVYLDNWPNYETTFQDLSRKIEPAGLAKGFAEQLSSLKPPASLGLEEVLRGYLEALNLYAAAYFFPPVYPETAFPTLQERFYRQSATLKAQKDYWCVSFSLPPAYPFIKELAYACRRLNEKRIQLKENKRIWFMLE